MSVPNENDTLRGLEALRDEIAKRLMANPDFITYQEISRTIENIKARLSRAARPITREQARVRVAFRGRMRGGRRSQPTLAYEFIKQAGRPVTSAEMFDALERGGNPIGGDRKSTNLSSVLSKDPRFESLVWPPSSQNRAWWLKGEPLPASEDLLSTHNTVSVENTEFPQL